MTGVKYSAASKRTSVEGGHLSKGLAEINKIFIHVEECGEINFQKWPIHVHLVADMGSRIVLMSKSSIKGQLTKFVTRLRVIDIPRAVKALMWIASHES